MRLMWTGWSFVIDNGAAASVALSLHQIKTKQFTKGHSKWLLFSAVSDVMISKSLFHIPLSKGTHYEFHLYFIRRAMKCGCFIVQIKSWLMVKDELHKTKLTFNPKLNEYIKSERHCSPCVHCFMIFICLWLAGFIDAMEHWLEIGWQTDVLSCMCVCVCGFFYSCCWLLTECRRCKKGNDTMNMLKLCFVVCKMNCLFATIRTHIYLFWFVREHWNSSSSSDHMLCATVQQTMRRKTSVQQHKLAVNKLNGIMEIKSDEQNLPILQM